MWRPCCSAKDGVAAGLSKGKIVVDMSSISPLATKEFAKKIEALGCDYLDAPVSGGEVGAKAASLTIMVGGPERAFDTMKPIFDKMGKNVTLVGANGDGQTTKVANQIIVALTIEAVGEALLFASKAGADPALVRQALMGGFASSRILEVHGERMVKRNFEPGFRIELHQKDLNLALEGARTLGLSLPNTATGAADCSRPAPRMAARPGIIRRMVRALELMGGARDRGGLTQVFTRLTLSAESWRVRLSSCGNRGTMGGTGTIRGLEVRSNNHWRVWT